jgi:hypothetical protein
MMRSLRKNSLVASSVSARSVFGVAPVLYFPPGAPKHSKEEQIKKNTNLALHLIKKFKGPLPQPYTRRHPQTFETIEKEVTTLLGGAAKMRKQLADDKPMDKLTLMERCLRHSMWSYLKEEGKYNFEEMEKWLVYTAQDETRLALLKREAELKEKYAIFKKKRGESGGPATSLPKFNWAEEYAASTDREMVTEKRLRYDTLAINTVERNDAVIDQLLKDYRQPAQLKRLDTLVDLLERFKPVLAREAIMQRLTIKHLEGQLGVWRYLDWNPEVRDRAELETDNYGLHWWHPYEEARMHNIRLRSKNEVKEIVEKVQQARIAEAQAAMQTTKKSKSDNSGREKLLQEILRLQSRIGKKDEDELAKKDDHKKKAAAHH